MFCQFVRLWPAEGRHIITRRCDRSDIVAGILRLEAAVEAYKGSDGQEARVINWPDGRSRLQVVPAMLPHALRSTRYVDIY